jgi:hypothetical protein
MLVALAFTAPGSDALAAAKRESKAATFGAIAHHPNGSEVGWASQGRTSREAGAEAVRLCGHPRCEVAITVRNSCAALARTPAFTQGPKRSRTQKGVSRGDAEARALSRCGPACEITAWVCTR